MGLLQFRNSKILLAYNRKMAFSGNCCRQCGCCPEGYAPEEVLVQFSGITNGDCDLCATMLNDSFVLPLESTDCWACGASNRGHAQWKYVFAPNECDIEYVRFSVGYYYEYSGWKISAMAVVWFANWHSIIFRNLYVPEEMPNCTELDNVSLGYIASASECNAASATCLVSSL
jgi:hypothetical protein